MSDLHFYIWRASDQRYQPQDYRIASVKIVGICVLYAYLIFKNTSFTSEISFFWGAGDWFSDCSFPFQILIRNLSVT